jgi:hypothetical protein
MNVIKTFSSSDVEAKDTIITEYELDQDGEPPSLWLAGPHWRASWLVVPKIGTIDLGCTVYRYNV